MAEVVLAEIFSGGGSEVRRSWRGTRLRRKFCSLARERWSRLPYSRTKADTDCCSIMELTFAAELARPWDLKSRGGMSKSQTHTHPSMPMKRPTTTVRRTEIATARECSTGSHHVCRFDCNRKYLNTAFSTTYLPTLSSDLHAPSLLYYLTLLRARVASAAMLSCQHVSASLEATPSS